MVSPVKAWFRKRLKPKTITFEGIRLSTDEAVVTKDIRKALYREDYEAEEVRLVGRHIRQGDRVLEIGGGIGLISLLCVKAAGAGNVHTFEPNPFAVEAIRTNYALNGLEPKLTQAAVALEDGETTFFFSDNIFSSSLIEREATKPSPVRTVDLRRLLREEEPTVLVLDAEGAEVDLLPALEGSSVRAVLAELHPHIVGEDTIAKLLETMAGFGYRETDRLSEKVVVLACD